MNGPALQVGQSLPAQAQRYWHVLCLLTFLGTHFAHRCWPSVKLAAAWCWGELKRAWPFLCEQGGVRGVLRTFFFGQPTET